MYRCEATSVEGFIQQLAVSYVANGYRFYVSGTIPAYKDPCAVDAKLIERYGLDCSKFVRCRRKKAGLANVQYLRFERIFVLVATEGQHRFFTDEAAVIRDFAREPLAFHGYSIGSWSRENEFHPSVRIAAEVFKDLKACFQSEALRSVADGLTREFRQLPFAPYAPVRRQLLSLLASVNRARKAAGMELVPATVLRLRRKPVRPFQTARLSGENSDGASILAQPLNQRINSGLKLLTVPSPFPKQD